MLKTFLAMRMPRDGAYWHQDTSTTEAKEGRRDGKPKYHNGTENSKRSGWGDVTKDLGEVPDKLIREGLVNHRELHNYSIALSFVKKLLAVVNMTNEMDSVLWIT